MLLSIYDYEVYDDDAGEPCHDTWLRAQHIAFYIHTYKLVVTERFIFLYRIRIYILYYTPAYKSEVESKSG